MPGSSRFQKLYSWPQLIDVLGTLGSSSLRPKEMLNSDQVSCVSSLFIFLLIYKHIKASKIEGHIRWRPLFKFPALFPENYQNKVPIYILKPLKWEFLLLLFSVLFCRRGQEALRNAVQQHILPGLTSQGLCETTFKKQLGRHAVSHGWSLVILLTGLMTIVKQYLLWRVKFLLSLMIPEVFRF